MNCCFLTEDSKSLLDVLPYWLEYLHFPCARVANNSDITHNSYSLLSGKGCYQLIDHKLYDTLDEIIQNKYPIDHLIIIIDTEEISTSNRIEEVEQKIYKYHKFSQITFSLKIIAVNCCFETWLLGNSNLYDGALRSKDDKFLKYNSHFNVKENDPECMNKPLDYLKTKPHYHFDYFHEMCRCQKIRYSKNRTKNVSTESFFKVLINRTKYTNQLNSFKQFIDYISELSTYKE